MDEVILGIPEVIEIFEDFESGLPGAPAWSYYSSTSQGRIDVNEVASNWVLRMDDTTYDSVYTLNEAILHFNYTDMNSATLTLDHWNKNDENSGIPDSFEDHYNGDGIAVSVDNYNWVKVTNLTGSFTAQTFDLTDEIATAAGGGAVSDVYIKFQQFDNMYVDPTGAGGDGREFDNIHVVLTRPGEPDPEMNCVIGTGATYTYYPSPDHFTRVDLGLHLPSDFAEDEHFSFFKPAGWPSLVSVHHTYNNAWPWTDSIDVPGNLTSASNIFELYDDDYDPSTLAPWTPTLPHAPTLEGGIVNYMGAFYDSYIEPNYLTSSYDDIVPFIRNLSDNEFEDITDEGELWEVLFDNPPSSGYWSVHSVTAYQGAPSEDSDPEVTGVCGGIALHYRNAIALFMEVIRENYPEGRIMAHEIVNTDVDIDDCSNHCIMNPQNPNASFCDDCLKKMRENNSNW